MLTRYVILVAWLLLLTKSKIYDCLIHKNTPTDLENLSGLIFVFCNAIIVMDRRGRRSLQEIANFLMRTTHFTLSFFIRYFT